jgi:hypothetical protein
MSRDCGKAFDSIESAHDFVGLLAEAVREAKKDIDADVQKGATNEAARRQVEALRMASYSLAKLEIHMSRSSRILNDLRTLRRLLNEERTRPPKAQPAKLALEVSAATRAEGAAIPVPESRTPVAAFSPDGSAPRARAAAA